MMKDLISHLHGFGVDLVRRLLLLCIVFAIDRTWRQKFPHIFRVVRFLVSFQNRRAGEGLTTHATPERSFACKINLIV